jgi:hypothetical protein
LENKDDVAIGSVALTSIWMSNMCHTSDSFNETYLLGLGKIKGMAECGAISRELRLELEETLLRSLWAARDKEWYRRRKEENELKEKIDD